jgi:uncharacterized protein (DUF305 family)
MAKRIIALAAVAAGTLTLAACSGSRETAVTTAGAGAVPFDRSFIDAMVPHHEAAIAMAEQAKELGLSEPDLVQIADAIIRTQQEEIDRMLARREEWFRSRELDPNAANKLGLDE